MTWNDLFLLAGGMLLVIVGGRLAAVRSLRPSAPHQSPAVPAPAPRALIMPRALALSPDQFCRIWRETDARDQRFQAVQQVIAYELLAAIDRAADPRLCGKPEQGHAAATMDALMSISASLDEAMTNPERWTGQRKSARQPAP